MRFRVQGSRVKGLRVEGSGLRVQGSRIQGLGSECRGPVVGSLRFRVWGSVSFLAGIKRFPGLGFRVQGARFRVRVRGSGSRAFASALQPSFLQFLPPVPGSPSLGSRVSRFGFRA